MTLMKGQIQHVMSGDLLRQLATCTAAAQQASPAAGKRKAISQDHEKSLDKMEKSIRTHVLLSPDGKRYVLNGSIFDVFTGFAQVPVEGDEGIVKEKISAVIVERGFCGLTSGPVEKKMNINASNMFYVHVDKVEIPKENLLGRSTYRGLVGCYFTEQVKRGLMTSVVGIRLISTSAVRPAEQTEPERSMSFINDYDSRSGNTRKEAEDIARYVTDKELSQQKILKEISDKIDTKFDKVDTKFDKVDTKFDKVDTKFDKVLTEMNNFYWRSTRWFVGAFVILVGIVKGGDRWFFSGSSSEK